MPKCTLSSLIILKLKQYENKYRLFVYDFHFVTKSIAYYFCRFQAMPDSTHPKTPPAEPHTDTSEKESIRKSQEEFVGDEATPSRDRSHCRILP